MKIIVFDFDECLGNFTFFYEIQNSLTNDIDLNFLLDLKILRPNVEKVFHYLHTLKKKPLIILYTNSTYHVPLYVLKIIHKKYKNLFKFVISRNLYWKWHYNKWIQLNFKRKFNFVKYIEDIFKLVNFDSNSEKFELIMFDDYITRANKNKYMITPKNKEIKYVVTNKNEGQIYLIPTYAYKQNKNFINKLFNFINTNNLVLNKKI